MLSAWGTAKVRFPREPALAGYEGGSSGAQIRRSIRVDVGKHLREALCA